MNWGRFVMDLRSISVVTIMRRRKEFRRSSENMKLVKKWSVALALRWQYHLHLGSK